MSGGGAQYKKYFKELSFCHKLRFSNSYFPRPLIFQTFNSGRSISLKFEITSSGCKDIGVRKFKFVATCKNSIPL